jgi:hypothetical protein
MLAYMNILFDFRLLDVLLLHCYYYPALDKYKYYIFCIFLYLACELDERSQTVFLPC